MSISLFLMVNKWNKLTGILCVGAEVAGGGERYVGKDIESIVVNLSLYWARVSSSLGGDNDLYEVEDGLGEKHVVPRSSIRHHDWHTICCGHISDDKLHDRFAMQQFTY